jgi:protein O-mannosyl-transferase
MTLLRLGVFGAACLVYLNSLGNGFALDDVVIILQNPRVHDVTAMRQIWLTPYWPDHGAQFGLWRPFAIYAYAIQWAVGGGSPLVFHVVSVALHALVSVLVFSLLNRLTATMPAFWGALIFAIHPVHTEAVANVVGQAELIAAASVLMACVAHASRRSGAGPPRRSVLLIGVLFAVAVMTKEHAVVLPALLVLVDLAQRRVQPSSQAVLAYARSMAGLAALLSGLTLAYLVVRYHVLDGSLVGQHAGPQLHYLHGEHRLVNALRAFPEYLRLLVWPASLAADYSPAMILPVDSISPMVVVGALLLAALAAMAVAAPWLAGVALPAAWLLVSLLTVSNFFFPVGVLVAERRRRLRPVPQPPPVGTDHATRRHCGARAGVHTRLLPHLGAQPRLAIHAVHSAGLGTRPSRVLQGAMDTGRDSLAARTTRPGSGAFRAGGPHLRP